MTSTNWLPNAKIKEKRLSSEASAGLENVHALQAEAASISADLRKLETRRREILDRRAQLRGLPADDFRLKNVNADLAPLVVEIDLLESALADCRQRQAATNEQTGIKQRLAGGAKAALQAAQQAAIRLQNSPTDDTKAASKSGHTLITIKATE